MGNEGTEEKKILITGASGLVGSSLAAHLQTNHFAVHKFDRMKQFFEDEKVYEGFDSIIHLAGENIAGQRWTKAYKEKIYKSRIDSTKKICEALSRCKKKPANLLTASAVGFYGDRGDVSVDESTTSGEGFLADVCRDWEAATDLAKSFGIRVVHLRFGVILSSKGGAFQKMLPPFRLGLGAPFGSGNQYMSWILLDDVISGVQFVLEHKDVSGPVNFVSPNPVTNRQFSETLAKLLKRPLLPAVPEFILKTMFGEMTKPLFLDSAKAFPEKLLSHGFSFSGADLQTSLRRILAKK